MFVFAIVLQSIGLIVGSILAAALLCWLSGRLAIGLHHPGWAPICALCLLLVALLIGAVRSEFAWLTVLLVVLGEAFMSVAEDRSPGVRNKEGGK